MQDEKRKREELFEMLRAEVARLLAAKDDSGSYVLDPLPAQGGQDANSYLVRVKRKLQP